MCHAVLTTVCDAAATAKSSSERSGSTARAGTTTRSA